MYFTMATTLFRAKSSALGEDSRLDKFCQRAVRFWKRSTFNAQRSTFGVQRSAAPLELVSAPRQSFSFPNRARPRPRTRIFCLCLMMATLPGCLVGPKYQKPAATTETLPASYKESPTQFKDGQGWKVAQPRDAMLRGPWWRIFKEPQLNALEEDLNINDQNIKQFFQNFMEARALVSEASAQLYPTLTANASYTRSSAGGAGGGSGGGGSVGFASASPLTSILTSLDLSWEPDLWGKVRNAIRSAQYNAQLSAADLENERLSEQASLATFFFQIRGQDALEKLFNDTIVADQKALDYTRAQYDTGITDRISVVQAENTLQNAQATATNLGVARAQFEHAIAVLTGRVASSFSIPVKTLDSSPPPIPIGVPSQLVERRPDVAAAERAMAQANAQIGIAYAAYFPTVTLSSSSGFSSSTFGQLFNASNHTWSIGPSVSETVFDAGLRGATVRQNVATYNANLAAYRQSVLTSFQQVEDGLAQVRILSKQLIQQQQAERSAQEFLKLEMGRYETGIDPYVDVVTAQTTLLTDQQAVITVRISEMMGAVALIKALGGGWDSSQLPTPSQVGKTPSHADTEIQQ
jgi:NodT family efflux transporter outer membrane factor (OMF) lipoprotein